MIRRCQVCGGVVDYDRRTGLREAKPHDEWRVGQHGPYETATPCAGSGRPTDPEERREQPVAEPPAGLTPMEFRVARLLRDTDLTAKQIAAGLGVSVDTVKTHQRHIHQKLEVRCRAELRASPLLGKGVR